MYPRLEGCTDPTTESLICRTLQKCAITQQTRDVLKMSQRRLLFVLKVTKTSFCTLWMSDIFCTLCVLDVSKTFFVRYALCRSQRRLLYVMDVSKTSFVRYGCLKDVFCMLLVSQRRLFVRYGYLKDVLGTSFVY